MQQYSNSSCSGHPVWHIITTIAIAAFEPGCMGSPSPEAVQLSDSQAIGQLYVCAMSVCWAFCVCMCLCSVVVSVKKWQNKTVSIWGKFDDCLSNEKGEVYFWWHYQSVTMQASQCLMSDRYGMYSDWSSIMITMPCPVFQAIFWNKY